MLMKTILVGKKLPFAEVQSKLQFNPLQLSISVNTLEYAALKPSYNLLCTQFGFKLFFCL